MRKGLIAMAISALSLAAPATSQAEIFTNERTPIDIGAFFVPCANGGTGEYVDLSGTFRSLFGEAPDASGGRHVVSQGVWTASGVGETTGDRYEGSSAILGTATFVADPTLGEQLREVTQPATLRIVGRQATFLVYTTLHLTFRPDGTLTAEVNDSRVMCR